MRDRLGTWWTWGIDPWQPLPAEIAARLDHLARQWRAAVAVMDTLPDHGRSSALPWYLVIGPPGSGKSTLLAQAGLGLDPIITTDANHVVVAGDFTIWVGPQAVFIEVAGALLCDHANAHDWRTLLWLIARARRHLPLRGVLLLKPLAEQFRQTPAETAAEATLTRERLQELTEITGAVLPTYVVITKADLLGGFKELFATSGRNEPVLGLSLSWPPECDPMPGVNRAYDGLLASLCDRRLTALATTVNEVAQRKLMQFPAQLRAALPYLSNHLAIALRPLAHTEPTLRGVYLTSVLPKPRARQETIASELNASEEPKSLFVAAPLAPPQPPVRSTIAAATTPTSDDLPTRALFVPELFAQVVLLDVHLAHQSAAARQHRRGMRVAFLIVAPAIIILLMLLSTRSTWRGIRLIDDLRASLAALAELPRGHTTDATTALLHIDRLGTALRLALAHHGTDLGQAGEVAAARYLRALRPVLLNGGLTALHDELAALRVELATHGRATAITERTRDVIRAYLMLGGLSAAQPELLTRVLLHERRWFRAVDPPGGTCDLHLETLARQQLDLCLSVLLPAGLLRVDIDRSLAEAMQRELGTRLPR